MTRQPRSVQQEDNTRISDSDMRLLNNLIFPMPPPEDATPNNPVTKVGILGLVSRHSASMFMECSVEPRHADFLLDCIRTLQLHTVVRKADLTR